MSSLNAQAITSIQFLQRQAASLLLYQSVLSAPPGVAFLELLETLECRDADGLSYLVAYGNWFKAIAATNQSWYDYIIEQILRNDNPFTRQAQGQELANLPTALVAAAAQDLQALQRIYKCRGRELSGWLQEALELPNAPVAWNSDRERTSFTSEMEKNVFTSLQERENWADALSDLAAYYREFGIGIFAEYRAFRWQSGKLVGIANPDLVRLKELTGYDSQKEALVKNTQFLLAGYPALHVLLYGSRGSGKSSLVKALLNESKNGKLRLIEVAKSDLKDLANIVELLRDLPQKFIIFVDDLSFEEEEDSFKALKVVLEGNVTARPENMVVYATSNRRHLIREFFGDRPRPSDAEEIHAWDTVQEKLSFSDRFGLTLTFEPADQKTYLTIVTHLAAQAGVTIDQSDLEYRALQWATRHNGRSGRTASQFVNFLRAELAISD